MLISDEYRDQQKELHKDSNYGNFNQHSLAPDLVTRIVNQLQITEILDYGCGKGTTMAAIKPDHYVRVYGYDPAIEEFSEPPEPCEFVTCLDVLEHVEPDKIDEVLDDLKRVTLSYAFFVIPTGPAVRFLPDGRNAHLIQQPASWWLPKIMERFELISFTKTENGFTVILGAYGT